MSKGNLPLIAGSITLVGFGFDSLIEVTSGAVLLWRLNTDVDESAPRSLPSGLLLNALLGWWWADPVAA